MRHESFIDCKALVVFCFILSPTYCKGTATGSLDIQPIHDLWREKCHHQKMPSLGDVGRCSCPQRASTHPSQAGVLFSRCRPQRWQTTTAASESSEVHPEESEVATTSQRQGLQSPEGPPGIPQLTVCALGFHPVVIVPSPVTHSWIREHLSRKGCLHCKRTMTEIIASPAPGCSC